VSKGVSLLLGFSSDQMLGQGSQMLFEDADLRPDPEDKDILCLSENGRIKMRGRIVAVGSHRIVVIKDASRLQETRERKDAVHNRWERLNSYLYPRFLSKEPVLVEDVIVVAVEIIGLETLEDPIQMTTACGRILSGLERWRPERGMELVGTIESGVVAIAGMLGGSLQSMTDGVWEFCDDVANVCEDVNWKLNLQLTFRMGFQVGGKEGHVAAGLYASDRGFAIVGRPITQAVTLMRSARPGTMHMSERAVAMLGSRMTTAVRRDEGMGRGGGGRVLSDATFDYTPTAAWMGSGGPTVPIPREPSFANAGPVGVFTARTIVPAFGQSPLRGPPPLSLGALLGPR
jgi:hypothetical protein